jgi:predicted dehydrogenase
VSDPLNVAVVGVGYLGRHHARILSTLPGASLIGVVDLDRERAERVAAEYHTRAYTQWQQIRHQVDAVSVAVPTELHLEVALPLLAQGVHVLVEKPLARSLDDADRMIAAARDRGVVLAVGHTERFNPAVARARPFVKEPRFIEVHRLGTFPDRSLDIDVVFDLMIHDLDLVLNLVGRDVTSIEAVGVPVLTPRVDIANVRLRFDGGCIANLTASRISRDRVRKIRFFQRDVYMSIDYAAQELEGWRLVRREGQQPTIEGGKLEVTREEPLHREIADFLGAIIDHRAPGVTGEEGRAALALAARIAERIEQNT